MYLNEIPEFDLLSTTPDKTAKKIKDELDKKNIETISLNFFHSLNGKGSKRTRKRRPIKTNCV